MTTIWKYPIEVVYRQEIGLPRGARVLSMQRHADGLVVWAEVDPSAPVERRGVRVVGTGLPIGEWRSNAAHIGTAILGPFVWHVFLEALELEALEVSGGVQ